MELRILYATRERVDELGKSTIEVIKAKTGGEKFKNNDHSFHWSVGQD